MLQFLGLLLTVVSYAQEVTGTIGGRVLDANSAAIANAEVIATHVETGAVRKLRTDANGSFLIPSMRIGEYQLSASHTGFKRSVRNGIDLHISDHLDIDLQLQVGDVTQEVTVNAGVSQVETETSEQGGLISGDQVRELQLNGRSFMTLLELLPGVASDMADRTDPNSTPSVSINGARSSSSNFTIDGGSNSDLIVGSGSLNTFTSVETIAEFKVITSAFAAEYGRGGFSQVNVVTRGGAKQFHGSVFEFVRNDAFDAHDFITHQVLPLKLNNFGYTFSGPVVLPHYNSGRQKTFFFFTQEFNLLSTRGDAVNTLVPTPQNKAGNFVGKTIVDPDNKNLAFPGSIIPASRLDPNAVKLLALYPDPNFFNSAALNYTSAQASHQNWREEMLRIDHQFSPGWKLYGRYSQDSIALFNPYGGTATSSITTRFPGISATNVSRPGQNVVLNMTNVFSQRLLNELSFTYASRMTDEKPASDFANRDKLGIKIPELFPENDGNVIPIITLNSSYATMSVARVYLKKLFNLEMSDNMTFIKGKHQFKFGGIYSFGGNRENPNGPATNGNFGFTTAFSRDPVANMLLGYATTYSETEHFVVSHARFGMAELYAQDDFRATSRLTLNYGLRYSMYLNPYDTSNILTNFLPAVYNLATAPKINPANGQRVAGTGDPLDGVVVAGQNSPFGKRVTGNNYNLFGPRFGFAWDIFGDRKTSLRGGYGIYYTRPFIGTFVNNSFDNLPFARTVTINNPLFRDPTNGALAPESTPALTALGVPMKAPTNQSWSIGIDRDLFNRAVLRVSYVGAAGTHLFRPKNLNDPPPGLAAKFGVNVNAVRPFLGYGAITVRESTGQSHYHSLQVSLNKRMTKTFSMGMAYTWAKSIDNASSERGGSDIPPDSRDARLERGPSDFDRTHVLTANYIYMLPKPMQKNSLFAPVVNGWQISGITRMYSGKPYDVQLSADVAGIGATQNQRPNMIANPAGPQTADQWWNPNAFGRPATGTFGNMGRNSLRGPGVQRWDISLFKNFALNDKGRVVQFRAEVFNALNHPSFTTIGTALTTTATGVNPNAASFDVVTGTRDAREMQFAVKLTF